MTFQNSIELLKFHSVAYSIYALMIISIVAWFGYNLAKKEKAKSIIRIPFYGYIAFLVIGGVGHHIFTYNTIPWVQEDMMKDQIKPDKVFHIQIKDHKWILPKTPMVVNCGKPTLFDVTSGDLMYGFGLFRQDGTIVTQMQVDPGHENKLMWTFNFDGTFNLTSTEYSGPAQYDEKGNDLLFVKNAVKVVGCENKKGGN